MDGHSTTAFRIGPGGPDAQGLSRSTVVRPPPAEMANTRPKPPGGVRAPPPLVPQVAMIPSVFSARP